MYFVGIDVSKNSFHYYISDSDRNNLVSGKLKQNMSGFTTFDKILKKFNKREIIIGMESTSIYHQHLFSYLLKHDYDVHIINPLLLKEFRKSETLRHSKNDNIDSKLISIWLKEKYPDKIPSSKEIDNFTQYSREIVNLSEEISRVKNEIKRYVYILFPELESFQSNIFTKSLMNLLHNFPSARKIATANKKQLIDAMKIDNQLYFDENKLDQIITLSKNSIASGNDAHELALQKRIELLFKLESDQKLFKEKLKETLNNSSNDVIKNQVELIQSLDGFNETALNIVAETGDINRFYSASALVAFVGIDPRTEESGQMKKGWFINRKGNRYLRKAVYVAATVAIQKNEYFKNYYMKLRTRGKSHTVAVLAVAGKLL